MKQISAQRFATGGLLAAAIAVLALAGFAWDYAQRAVSAAGVVNHTHRVKGVIRELESALYRAEAGQRAYLSTRNASFRQERDAAVESLQGGLAEVERLTGDSAAQQARVHALRREIGARLVLFHQTESLITQGEDYPLERRIELGAQALSAIKPLVVEMMAEEDRLLAQREAVQRDRARSTALVFGALVALLLVLLPLIFWRMARDLRARGRAEVLVARERAFESVNARALTLYNAENDRQRVLDGTLALLAEDPLYPVAAFYAHDEWGGVLRLAASHAAPADIRPELRLDEGPVGTAAREGRPVYLQGFDRATGLHIETGLAVLHPAALLICPVQHQGRLQGVLALGASARLDERSREFVSRLCAQLAVALHNLGQIEEMGLLAAQLRSRGEDIQRKNAELERANRMKSEFLANMSHELRTPLNAIIGFSELMKDGLAGPLGREQQEFAADIYTSGKHLLSLINDILDLSKVESGHVALELEEADPQALAASAMSVLRERAAAARVRFSAHCAPQLGHLRLDTRKAKQIIYNLVSNALKFTPEGGKVTLALDSVSADVVRAARPSDDTRVFAPPEGGFARYLELRVTDTGIGIAPDDLQQLFQAFVQIDSSLSRQYAGTGLGLTMVRRLAEMHGGGLMVHSEEGRGSAFVVWLPWREVAEDARAPAAAASQRAAAPADSGVAAEAAEPATPLVLLVEDDPRAASLMRLQLEGQGYRVASAATAEEGLVLAARLHPSLLVLDVILPGMDGWDMLAQLKASHETRHVPVVIVSITDEAQRGFALGAAQVLVKPVTQYDLLTALAAAGLDAPRPEARVLVVDDDPKAVALVSRHLQVAGYTPVAAYGGQEALALARSEHPALIVLDLMMPQMSGFDVVQGLRQHPDTAGIPVIVLTAQLLTRHDRELLSGKVHQVMEKTRFSSQSLLSEVRRALVGRQQRQWEAEPQA